MIDKIFAMMATLEKECEAGDYVTITLYTDGSGTIQIEYTCTEVDKDDVELARFISLEDAEKQLSKLIWNLYT